MVQISQHSFLLKGVKASELKQNPKLLQLSGCCRWPAAGSSQGLQAAASVGATVYRNITAALRENKQKFDLKVESHAAFLVRAEVSDVHARCKHGWRSEAGQMNKREASSKRTNTNSDLPVTLTNFSPEAPVFISSCSQCWNWDDYVVPFLKIFVIQKILLINSLSWNHRDFCRNSTEQEVCICVCVWGGVENMNPTHRQTSADFH